MNSTLTFEQVNEVMERTIRNTNLVCDYSKHGMAADLADEHIRKALEALYITTAFDMYRLASALIDSMGAIHDWPALWQTEHDKVLSLAATTAEQDIPAFAIPQGWACRSAGMTITLTPDQVADLERTIRDVGLALNLCNHCVTTDLPEVQPEPDRSWRIDHSQELAGLYRLAATLGLSTGTAP